MKRLTFPVGKLSVLLVAAVVVVALAGTVHAQQRGYRSGGQGPNQEEMINRIVDRLDLTEEQQEQMKQIHIEHREETETLREQMNTAHERLAALIDADPFDEAAIREAAAEYSGYQTEMFVSRAAVQQELREILTPEQYAEMKEMRNQHHGMMMRHGEGQGHKRGRSHHGRNQPAPEDG